MNNLDNFADINGIRVCYRTLGNSDHPPLLLIMGLGAQLIGWPEGFVEKFVEEGFFVISFDNRDCGLSTKTDGEPHDSAELLISVVAGEGAISNYSLSDMAKDAISLLDFLGVEAAHIVGASMGGMIAQTVAIEYPDKVLSLTSIMSSTGKSEEFTPTEEALNALLTAPENSRAQIIEVNVSASQTLSGPHWNESFARDQAQKNFDRSFHPKGVGFQIGAIAMSGDRTSQLLNLEMPCLVIHGSLDPLLPLHCGVSTADAIPNAELLILEDMAHDLPQVYWDEISEGIKSITSKA
ncbi:MAG: alpha/beta hydrolase [Acidimicrobiales bacterium]|nr:alpha/beta hydrolase [Acidimicrobiales bacterium]MDP6298662.1 alpha/beta hydrolase [Acidimicrobiales bacterium]HJM28858.1 alpha/beta hydrolase [Acidimicrobiales bacterium]